MSGFVMQAWCTFHQKFACSSQVATMASSTMLRAGRAQLSQLKSNKVAGVPAVAPVVANRANCSRIDIPLVGKVQLEAIGGSSSRRVCWTRASATQEAGVAADGKKEADTRLPVTVWRTTPQTAVSHNASLGFLNETPLLPCLPLPGHHWVPWLWEDGGHLNVCKTWSTSASCTC
jgi:hypothetical protein